VTPSTAIIADTHLGIAMFRLAVQYSTVMSGAVAPTIAFNPAVNTILTFASGTWNAAHSVYTATYNVANASVSLAGVAVTVRGAQKADGNLQTVKSQNAVFGIDTVIPTVTKVTPSTAIIADTQLGIAMFRLAVQYSTVMNGAVAPTIAFSPAVSSTLTLTSGSWNAAHTIYTAVYKVANANISVQGIGVTVGGARSADGNAQVSFNQNSVFAIDTVNPTVTSVSPSVATVADAQAGNTGFSVSVTYSAAMDPTVDPTITFSPAVSSTLAFAFGNWDGTDTVYTATYTVTSAGVHVPAVAITVAGGQNSDGNPQPAFTQPNAFSADTVSPTVTAVKASVATITNAQVGNNGFSLSLTFSSAMGPAVNPTISFSPDVSSTLVFASGAWNAAHTIYTASYNVANAGVSVSNIQVTISGGENSDGNLQLPIDVSGLFGISTVS
jgi:hypothetical protein